MKPWRCMACLGICGQFVLGKFHESSKELQHHLLFFALPGALLAHIAQACENIVGDFRGYCDDFAADNKHGFEYVGGFAPIPFACSVIFNSVCHIIYHNSTRTLVSILVHGNKHLPGKHCRLKAAHNIGARGQQNLRPWSCTCPYSGGLKRYKQRNLVSFKNLSNFSHHHMNE